MVEPWLPWNEYPGLTQDRLLIVGDIIRTARADALKDHRPEKFETNWSLGVRQFERTNGSITWKTQEYPWLTVIAGEGGGPVQYVFCIGGHPIRVCRGDEEDVANHFRTACQPELDQQLLLFALDTVIYEGKFLRIVIENDAKGIPLNIYLVQMDDDTGKPIQSYLIPVLAAMPAASVAEFAPQADGVELPPVTAEPVEEAETAGQEVKKKTGSDG
jgi:hypothetical protein